MKGSLADYFESFAVKRLSAVEADKFVSHQHEFNGVNEFKKMFGLAKREFAATILYLADDEDDYLATRGKMTWYDARENHKRRSEHRLYYPASSVFDAVKAGDLLVICKIKSREELLVIITEAGSSTENQIRWLFSLQDDDPQEAIRFNEVESSRTLSFLQTYILEQVGIDVTDNFIEVDKLDLLLRTFPDGYPATKVFSEFARTDSGISAVDCQPDSVILCWMEHEEILFRTLEKYLIDKQLTIGFRDVEDFLSFSLSIHNRRKSRAGHAFENHLCKLFADLNIRFSHNKQTEKKSRPDFIFPGIDDYHNPSFPAHLLYMLAVKTTCKDRWRQVLAEAERITAKHLITLEPGISRDQTDEMFSHNLSLVVPESIHATYASEQRQSLLSLNKFIELVR